MAGSAVSAERDTSKKPVDSDFHQQRLKAWQPLLTPRYVIATFAIVAVIFAVIGGVIIEQTKDVVELSQRYDNLAQVNGSHARNCSLEAAQSQPISSCFTITVTQDMTPPIYVYYKLVNFYQNHRRYVKSRSDSQLQGDDSPSTSACDPLTSDSEGRTYYPCGLIAASMFNDTINATLVTSGGDSVDLSAKTFSDLDNPDWQKRGIAWESDLNHKFKYQTPSYPFTNVSAFDSPLPRADDEDLVVWMRTSGLPTFKKLYRKIVNPDRTLRAGDTLLLSVDDQFPVASFNGEKHVVIATTSWIGGRNLFLGWAYVSVAIACAVVALAFTIKQCTSPRRLGDLHEFKGRRARASH